MPRSLLLLPSGLLVLLVGCKPEETKPPPEEEPETELRYAAKWHRAGLGEAWALAASDLDGDGSDEIFYGGRTVAALDGRSRAKHTPKWTLDWLQTDRDVDGNDNSWATDLATFDATGDGVDDLLVLSVDNDAHLVDGATGEPAWSTTVESEIFTTRLALFDGDADGVPDFFPNYGNVAYSGATGEELWSYDFPTWPLVPLTAEVNGEAGDDLIVVREIESGVEDFEAAAAPTGEVAVYAFAPDGTVVWEHAPDALVTAAAAADLDGDGLDEVYLGHDGALSAGGADGELWAITVDGPVTGLLTADANGDGVEDVIALVRGIAAVDTLVAVSSAGETLWTQPVEGLGYAFELLDVDGDGVGEIVLGSGSEETPSAGWTSVIEVDAAAETRVRWAANTKAPASAVTMATIDGTSVLLAGLRDGRLAALDVAAGTESWDYVGGRFIEAVASGQLDGDNADEVVHGDDAGYVVRTDVVSGEEIWATPLDADGLSTVLGVAIGPLDGDKGVVASGVRYGDSESPGIITRLDANGELVWSVTTTGWPTAASIGDLDGDGDQEVIYGTVAGGVCSVHVLEADGSLLWETEVAECFLPVVHAGDVDSDGDVEIAYGDVNITGPMHVALLDGEEDNDYEILWSQELEDRDSYWIRAVPGAVIHGGYTTNDRGHVTSRTFNTGAQLWEHLVEPSTDADGMTVAGGVFHGASLTDLDNDGYREVGIGTEVGDVRVLSGATGLPIIHTRLEEEGLPSYNAHHGGPMTWVDARPGVRAYLAVAQSDAERTKAKAFAIDITGEILGSVDLRGESHAMVGINDASGADGVVLGGGLGLYALDVERVEVPAGE